MRIYFVDSFTTEPFRGNPAAVVIQDKVLADGLMQSIAQEIGFSETAFLSKEGCNKYSLRWFSPTTEVGLCGHASLATAKVFFTNIHPEMKSVDFFTKYGKLSCYQEGKNIRMDFPYDKLNRLAIYDKIKDYFAFPINKSIFFSKINRYLSIQIDDSEDLTNLKINSEDLMSLNRIVPQIRGLIISNQNRGNVQIRFFDPWEGIAEDPVTGSAALVVSELWFDILQKDYFELHQLSKRGGKMFIQKEKECVSIIGSAKIVLEGKLKVGKNGE